ncbi:MAG: hypothetical protein EXS15_04790 [Phycisphaerales bacterium]|nr:hypothetical protein [Phycisphaerales bacterium]
MISIVATVAIAVLSGPPIHTLKQSAVLDANAPTVSLTFGMVVAVSGDRIAATGPDPSRTGGSVGQIATFQLQPTGEWTCFREMQSVDQVRTGDMILGRMAMSGEVLLVSDERRDGRSSTVVAFESASTSSGWKQVGRLDPPLTVTEPAFGMAVATDGVIAAVSTVDMRVLGEKPRTVQVSPKVFLFKRGPEGWSGIGFLQRDESQKPTFFGASLAMTPGQLVIGCPKAVPAAPHQQLVVGGEAVVVVYRQNQEGMWTIDGELRPPADRLDHIGFGSTIAADDSTIAVRMSMVTAPTARVLVYRRGATGWVYDGELTPLIDVTPGAGWGYSLAVADGRVVVGDSTALNGDQPPGYVGVFARASNGSWGESMRLQPSVKVMAARWGVALRADGRRVVVARPQSERDGIVPGGALLFMLPPVDQVPVPSAAGSAPATLTPLTAPATK